MCQRTAILIKVHQSLSLGIISWLQYPRNSKIFPIESSQQPQLEPSDGPGEGRPEYPRFSGKSRCIPERWRIPDVCCHTRGFLQV